MDDKEVRYMQMLNGRISRRQLIGRGVMLGLGVPTLAGLVQACGSGTTGGGGTTSAGETIQLYSSTDTAQQVGDAFAKIASIPVYNYNDDAGVVLARVEAESSHPRADVYLLSDAEGMAGLAQQGRFLAYKSPQRSTMSDLALKVSDPGGLFTAVGLSGAGPFIYNTKALSAANAPADWPDLLKPAFKDQIAITDPAFSGPSYGAIFGILQRMGSDAGWQYIAGLFKNGLKVYKTNTPTLAAVESGGRSIALAQDSAAFYDRVVSGAPLAVVYPTSGTVLQGDAIAIEAKSPNVAAAKQFVDYVLSTAGQTAEIGDAVTGNGVSGDAWLIPVQPGVQQNAARISANINWTFVDLNQAAKQEATIKARFKSLSGG